MSGRRRVDIYCPARCRYLLSGAVSAWELFLRSAAPRDPQRTGAAETEMTATFRRGSATRCSTKDDGAVSCALYCIMSYLCRILLSNTSVHFHFYSTLATAPVSSSPVCAPLAGDGARCGGDTQPSYTCFHCPATHCLDQEHHTWVSSPALPVSIRRNYGQKLTLSPGGVSTLSTPDIHNMCA